MPKMLHFIDNQPEDNSENELLQLQEFALTSSAEPKADEDSENVKHFPSSSLGGDVVKQADAGRNSFLEKNVVITGSITSVSTIEIEGQVNGNVSCKNDVLVNGVITGDISAVNVRISSGRVNGNIDCQNSILLDKESSIKGDISGESLDCDGKIEGNTKMKAKATITSNAVVLGDIFASRISIEEGVQIKGRLQVNENKTEDEGGPEPKPEKETAGEVKDFVIDGQKYI